MRWIGGGFFMLVGVVILISATVSFVQAGASESWPSVDGTMVRSEVGGRYTASEKGKSGHTTYLPTVEYTYVVEGKDYAGRRYELIERGEGDRATIERKLRDYPVGATVKVFYDPDEPAESLLKPGRPDAMGIPFVLGFIAIAVGGVVMLAFGPKEKPYKRRR